MRDIIGPLADKMAAIGADGKPCSRRPPDVVPPPPPTPPPPPQDNGAAAHAIDSRHAGDPAIDRPAQTPPDGSDAAPPDLPPRASASASALRAPTPRDTQIDMLYGMLRESGIVGIPGYHTAERELRTLMRVGVTLGRIQESIVGTKNLHWFEWLRQVGRRLPPTIA